MHGLSEEDKALLIDCDHKNRIKDNVKVGNLKRRKMKQIFYCVIDWGRFVGR